MSTSDDIARQEPNEPSAGVPASARLLLRIVYIMGIILVLLFLTLVGGIIWKSSQKSQPKPQAPPAMLDLGLPAGTEIRHAEIDGDRLVINTGRLVIVIDLRKNTILSRISAGD
jgi:hypothetical protein